MKEFDLDNLSKQMPYRLSESFFDDMTEKVMDQIGVEKYGKQMPYAVPEDFFENVAGKVMSQIGELNGGQVRKSRRSIWLSLASVACTAAVVVLFINPFRMGGMDIPDYDNLSQCASIDEMFQSVSANDLGLYSMTSNYWGD